MDLLQMLIFLADHGCFPSIFKSGSVWKATADLDHNYWAEAETPSIAMNRAIEKWAKYALPPLTETMADWINSHRDHKPPVDPEWGGIGSGIM